jgi:hypothetical protein
MAQVRKVYEYHMATSTHMATSIFQIASMSDEHLMTLTEFQISQILVVKGETTIMAYSEFEHDYVYGDGPYEARLSGCCRPEAQSSTRQGLINNPKSAFKIAAAVVLTTPSWAESPFFIQPPVVQVPLATSTNIQLTAAHPTMQVEYRLGSISDAGVDLTSEVPLDKRGNPEGVGIDPRSGVLSLPKLFEAQFYSMHVVALSPDTGASSSVDFYLHVVDGKGSLAGTNHPPTLEPVRVPSSIMCGEENKVMVRAKDPEVASDIGLIRFESVILLVRNASAFTGGSAMSLSISGPSTAPLASLTWSPPCEPLSANRLYDYRLQAQRFSQLLACMSVLHQATDKYHRSLDTIPSFS